LTSVVSDAGHQRLRKETFNGSLPILESNETLRQGQFCFVSISSICSSSSQPGDEWRRGNVLFAAWTGGGVAVVPVRQDSKKTACSSIGILNCTFKALRVPVVDLSFETKLRHGRSFILPCAQFPLKPRAESEGTIQASFN
jgi:hypothetical protein